MKKKKITSRAVDSLASLRENLLILSPPPPAAPTSAEPLLLLYFVFLWFSCGRFEAIWFCYSSPKRFKTTPKFVTFKLLIYFNLPKCNLVPLQVSTCWGLIPRGGTPYNGPYGEALPEIGTFLRLQGQGYERLGISIVEVYERVGRSVISVGKKRV